MWRVAETDDLSKTSVTKAANTTIVRCLPTIYSLRESRDGVLSGDPYHDLSG